LEIKTANDKTIMLIDTPCFIELLHKSVEQHDKPVDKYVYAVQVETHPPAYEYTPPASDQIF
jgi:hypothetical protein